MWPAIVVSYGLLLIGALSQEQRTWMNGLQRPHELRNRRMGSRAADPNFEDAVGPAIAFGLSSAGGSREEKTPMKLSSHETAVRDLLSSKHPDVPMPSRSLTNTTTWCALVWLFASYLIYMYLASVLALCKCGVICPWCAPRSCSGQCIESTTSPPKVNTTANKPDPGVIRHFLDRFNTQDDADV
ncbi:unnamed protein product [Cyprideis torosa]|uniref:Uncharacterized protein n=1 Tax=Cyprideis torosa TaxID=163714 RepID=A0A7R8W987_9CRUS|nr:unnamed protein product [Cyprideis torosa]CAG0884033.1 unnamed protein product [Cyprideis torosa]